MFGWLFARSKEKAPEVGATLSDMVRGIAHAASAANEISDQQMLKQMQYYFELKDGELCAKTARVRINDGHVMDVPLVSLVDPATLGLEEMKVRMAVRLSKSVVKSAAHKANEEAEVSRCSFHVALTGAKPGSRKDVIDVTMTFKRQEPVETAARILEELGRTVAPKPLAATDVAATDEEIAVVDTSDFDSLEVKETKEEPPAG